MADTIKCYCLQGPRGFHCPLVSDRSVLEQTWNYKVRGEAICEVEIDSTFVCKEERSTSCDSCPFK